MSSFYVNQLLLGRESSLIWLIYPMTLLEKLVFPLPEIWITDSLFVRDGTPMFTSHSFWQNPSCACCKSVTSYVHQSICIQKILFFFSECPTSSISYNLSTSSCSFLSSEGRGLMKYGIVILLVVILLFRMLFVILGLFNFHMKLKITFSISVKNSVGILIGTALNL